MANCYFGANESGGHITKDFYLVGWDETDWKVIRSKDGYNAFPKNPLIDHSVFAVGNNNDFIIIKQHPHLDKALAARLGIGVNSNWNGEIKNLADTIFLKNGDKIYRVNDKYYHTNTDWTDPDSLKPYKRITNYYIIDLRYSDEGYKLYKFNNENEFNATRQALEVPADLTFTFLDRKNE